MMGSLLQAPLSLPTALLPTSDTRPYESMTTEELEGRLAVNEERLKLYRNLGRLGGATASVALRRAVFPR
jgi:hypothetical protein